MKDVWKNLTPPQIIWTIAVGMLVFSLAASVSHRIGLHANWLAVLLVFALSLLAVFLLFRFIRHMFLPMAAEHHLFREDGCGHLLWWWVLATLAGCWLVLVVPIQSAGNFRLLKGLSDGVFLGSLILFASVYVTKRKDESPAFVEPSALEFTAYILTCSLSWGLVLLAFWPAVMSRDSIDQWGQIISGQFVDIHPAFHTMSMWLVTRIALHPSTVACAQILALGAVMGWAMVTFRGMGVSRKVTMTTTAVFALSLVNGLMVITIWKDVAYAIAFLVFGVILLKIIWSEGQWLKSKKSQFLFGAVIFLVAIYRHNGIAIAFGTPLVLVFFFRPYWKAVVFSLFIGMLFYGLIKGPVYQVLNIDRHLPLSGLVRGPLFHTMDASRLFLYILKKTGIPHDIDKKIRQNRKYYETVGKNKTAGEKMIAALRIHALSNSMLWRVMPLEGVYRGYRFSYLHGRQGRHRYVSHNEMGLTESSRLPRLRDVLYELFVRSYRSTIGLLMWTPSLYVYLFMGSLVCAALRTGNWKYLLMFVPFLLHMVSFFFVFHKLFIFRYHYPLAVVGMSMSLPMFFLSQKKVGRRTAAQDGRRWDKNSCSIVDAVKSKWQQVVGNCR